jgi:hypothetical protein
MMPGPYIARPEDIAGFDLYGTRNNDGTITIGHSAPEVTLPSFPDEVELLGNVYTLEFVRENGDDGDGRIEKWRKEAASDDPRLRICWGVYV